MKTYTFHLLGLVHLPTAKKYLSCAFTQKNIKLARMLTSLGHTVYLYGARSTEEAPLEEYVNSENFHFIETHTVDDIRRDYGTGDNRSELGYAWWAQDFKHDLSTTTRKPSTEKFYAKAIEHINKVKHDEDFLLCTQGQYHRPISEAVGLFLKCESGIGYRGTCPEMFRCFESSYGQNFSYGSENPYGSSNGSYYDRVIPNYFDPDDVEFSPDPGKYFLFIGRLIKRKGILTAYMTSKALGAELIIAGQGGLIDERGYLIDNHPKEFEIPNDSNWKYVGYAGVEERKKLMAGAIATFVATEYLEMFGGVNVESRLAGTPVITTNFGCFPEYVENGKDGYRCDTLQDFVNAAKMVNTLDRNVVRKRAERFLMDNVKYEYQKWFDDLYQLYRSATIPGERGWSYIKP